LVAKFRNSNYAEIRLGVLVHEDQNQFFSIVLNDPSIVPYMIWR